MERDELLFEKMWESDLIPYQDQIKSMAKKAYFIGLRDGVRQSVEILKGKDGEDEHR